MTGKPVTIDWLVHWTFGIQRAEFLELKGAGLYGPEAMADGVGGGGRDSTERVTRFLELEAIIQGSGTAAGGGDVHADALAVMTAVQTWLPAETASLVRLHGTAGRAPEWLPRGTYLAPLRWANGKVVKGYNGARYDDKRAVYCKLRQVNGPDTIRTFRRRYCRWWVGMWLLAEGFRQQPELLRKHCVTGVSARPFPWLVVPPKISLDVESNGGR